MSADYTVKPVAKALQVLICLEKGQMTLTEISRLVDLPKTSVFRYLYTLQQSGLVTLDLHTERYALGYRLFELARAIDSQTSVRELAQPIMQQLRDQFNETVNLGVIEQNEVVYMEIVESRHALRMEVRPGSHDRIHSTALGKAIMAHLPEKQWAYLLPEKLEAITPRTITSKDRFYEHLNMIRETGYSVDDGENEVDAYCIAAPIFNGLGVPTAAISISAPNTRLSDATKRDIIEGVMQAAQRISKQLGY